MRGRMKRSYKRVVKRGGPLFFLSVISFKMSRDCFESRLHAVLILLGEVTPTLKQIF